MLDIKYIKDNVDDVITKLNLRAKDKDFTSEINEAVALYAKRNEALYAVEQLKATQNQVTKQIPALKKEGKDTTELMADMKALSEQIKEADVVIKEIDENINIILLNVPNVPHESVPVGYDESENQVVRVCGEQRKFDFTPLPHWEIGAKLGILDAERAAKVSGSRFMFYVGDGARLERAIANYFLDMHAKSDYTEIFSPFLVNRASMTGTGQLPKFEEDMFKLTNNEKDDYFLIPTTEVPMTNYHADEILMFGDGEQAKSYCGFSTNFRREAGSAGRDTRGLIRQHQFNKVELVKFALPEHSHDELERLTSDAEKVLQGLGFAYRVSLLCAGDMGFCATKAYDIEVYMPSYERYVEISSCSNFEDYQARRANIRYKKSAKDKAQFVHTLNGSGVAVGRTTACILENYQNTNGTVTIPEVLRPYMGGQKVIG